MNLLGAYRHTPNICTYRCMQKIRFFVPHPCKYNWKICHYRHRFFVPFHNGRALLAASTRSNQFFSFARRVKGYTRLYRRLKGYTRFFGKYVTGKRKLSRPKYVTGRRKRSRPHKVYIFLLRITSRVDLVMFLIKYIYKFLVRITSRVDLATPQKVYIFLTITAESI